MAGFTDTAPSPADAGVGAKVKMTPADAIATAKLIIPLRVLMIVSSPPGIGVEWPANRLANRRRKTPPSSS
jgi:hypothetical protein